MSAEPQHPSRLSSLLKRSRTGLQRSKVVWLLAVILIIAVAAWARSVQAAGSSTVSDTAITPALKLAVGTVRLEDTDQAIDATAAAQLLPLWRLLAQLNASGSAAPQEITAVVDEIKLNMTSDQVKAIDAMTISTDQLQTSSAKAPTAATGATSQASAAVGDLSMGGDMSAGGPPADGGSMPSSSSKSSTSTGSTSTASTTPAAIRQVIQLLESKVQSG